jgi:hypothetical protein
MYYLEIHEHRPGGVCDVGDVIVCAADSAGQVPYEPRVDVAEHKSVVVHRIAHRRNVLQKPFEFESAKRVD